jgi:hypothetical protein
MRFLAIILSLSFKLIPADYYSQINLLKSIIPRDSITCWQYGISPEFLNSKYYILYSSDTLTKIEFPKFTDNNTYRSYYFSSFGASEFLVYKTQTGEIKFISDENDFLKFIKPVKNLADALFLASMYGYRPEPGKKCGSYKNKNGLYFLNLYKIVDPPDFVKITYIRRFGKNIVKKHDRTRIIIDRDGNVYETNGHNKKTLIRDMHRTI